MKLKHNYVSEFVTINGLAQYLLHYPATKEECPVLLFLHGGPGMAESVFSYYFQQDLSSLFHMVYWDQRGAGKTLAKDKHKHYPSPDELLYDLKEVISYLKIKYKKEKVILLGHSWGSVLASLYAMNSPRDLLYYIGAGQVVDILENERVGYLALKERIINGGNHKDLNKLNKIANYPELSYNKDMIYKIKKIRILQGKYKIGMNFPLILKTLFKSPSFQLQDLKSLLDGMTNNTKIWDFLFSNNLYNYSLTYEIPIFYILGEKDFQAPHIIASKYFDSIHAPLKKLYLQKDASHFMMLDNPTQFTFTLQQIHEHFE